MTASDADDAAPDDADIEFAHRLVSAATQAVHPYVGDSVAHRSKSDGSPVSEADLAAEAAMLAIIRRERPDDGVLSEEAGAVATGRRRWILDPIDGTDDFVNGREEWGTHVALQVGGRIVLGIISRPLRGQRWWAAAGRGAFRDADSDPTARSTRLRTSPTTTLDGARIGLYRSADTRLPEILARYGASTRTRGSHILDLVEGDLDAAVSERGGFVWDQAPAVILAIESTGHFSDPTGGRRPDLMGGIYSNGHLHRPLDDAITRAGIDLGLPDQASDTG